MKHPLLLLVAVALLVVLAYVMWPREPVRVLQMHTEPVHPFQSGSVDR